MNAHITRTVAIAMIIGMVTSAGASEIYRWVDDDGNVHYTDKPVGELSERLEIQSRPTEAATVDAQLLAVQSQREASEDRRSVALEQKAVRENAAAERQHRQEQCSMYQERLAHYVQNRRFYRDDESGERTYLDEAKMAEVRAKTQSKVDEYCS